MSKRRYAPRNLNETEIASEIDEHVDESVREEDAIEDGGKSDVDSCEPVDPPSEEAVVSIGDDGLKIERVTEPLSDEKRLWSRWLKQNVTVICVEPKEENHLRVVDQDGKHHVHPRGAFGPAR